MTSILVATESTVLVVDANRGTISPSTGLGDRPTCITADSATGRAWCGTQRGGAFRSDDDGVSWRSVGLEGRRIMSIAASPARPNLVWVGTEPSEVWRSENGGESWEQTSALEVLPSSPEWSFPPKPNTNHVRWIACHPVDADRLWVAIEAGALVSTLDGGRNWRDRVEGGPWDTHELAIHPDAPTSLRVAAGDGYFESDDGGATWRSPDDGLAVGYLRSVAIDPGRTDVVIVSASSGPRSAYVAGVSDGRLYRREGGGRWELVSDGWPEPPNTIAPLLTAGKSAGELWAADERGVHRSIDGGVSWRIVARYASTPNNLRGLSVLG
jgi:ligand-binding sensor domain-containing protein